MDLPRDEVLHLKDIQPGHWGIFRNDDYGCVVMRCPICLALETVSARVHEIAPNGTCSPSFVCWRVAKGGCTFHVMARLIGWEASIKRTI